MQIFHSHHFFCPPNACCCCFLECTVAAILHSHSLLDSTRFVLTQFILMSSHHFHLFAYSTWSQFLRTCILQKKVYWRLWPVIYKSEAKLTYRLVIPTPIFVSLLYIFVKSVSASRGFWITVSAVTERLLFSESSVRNSIKHANFDKN